jgi:murein DD-endopeptidase MepM/ murein hydrolase activator NlpD
MANPDDMKVGVLADLNDIEQQGVRAGEAFKKGFGQGFGPGGVGGALLGSGMAPTQGPSPSPSDSVSGLLDKILQTLQTGFGRMLEAAGGGLGGGAATGGTFFSGGYNFEADKKQAVPPPPPKEGGGGGGMGGVLGAANAFPQQSYANMYNSGFYGSNVAQFAASATSNIPLVGQFMGVVSNTMQQRDSALRDLLGVFRGGGVAAWKNFHNSMSGAGQADLQSQSMDFMKQYGVDRSEAGQLNMIASKAGRAGDSGAWNNLIRLQGLYGMGQQGGDLMGTLQRGGADKNAMGGDQNLFANVLATAIGTNLDRGRWGEAFEAISKAAGRIQTGNIDTQGVFGMMNFVGSMGARFRGNSQASESMVGMLQGMQGGSGGQYGNLAALQAAGLGQPGVSFTDAWMKVQRGAAAGGVGLREVLKQHESLPVVQEYLKAGDKDPKLESKLSTAVYVLSRLLPAYKPTDIEALLRAMRSSDYKTGRIFDGAGKNDVFRMSQALEKGTIPQKERELVASEINDKMQWSEDAIGSGAQQFPNQPESRANVDAAVDADMKSGNISPSMMQQYGDFAGVQQMPGDLSTGPSMTSAKFLEEHVKGPGGKYGAQRPDTDFHPGLDVMPTKPGQSIHSPCDGTVIQVIDGTTAKAGAPGKGIVIKADPSHGSYLLGIFHIDPKSLKVKNGSTVKKGQVLGRFLVKGFRKGVADHAHISVQKGARWKTPSKENTYAPEEQLNVEDIVNPGGKPAGEGAAGEAGGTGAAAGAGDAGAGASGPTSMMMPSSSPSGLDVNIYVHDRRISVTQEASKKVRRGDPNRNYGNRG